MYRGPAIPPGPHISYYTGDRFTDITNDNKKGPLIRENTGENHKSTNKRGVPTIPDQSEVDVAEPERGHPGLKMDK